MTDNHPNWKFETQTIHAGQVIDEFSKSRRAYLPNIKLCL